MIPDDLPTLSRAHELFVGQVPAHLSPTAGGSAGPDRATGDFGAAYRTAAALAHQAQDEARTVDHEFARILTAVERDHAQARLDTGAVVAAARSDRTAPPNPIAARETLRRRLHRLHAQRGHVLAARRRALRHRAALAGLHYRRAQQCGATADARSQRAVRAALSRLGCPYVWGAAGPDRFDCSGLVKWSYEQAGVPLHRTTYDQINDGIPVARADVRPGDLVFPHIGHVQMAVGNNQVIEAPYAGAPVRISQMGPAIAIRRPG